MTSKPELLAFRRRLKARRNKLSPDMVKLGEMHVYYLTNNDDLKPFEIASSLAFFMSVEKLSCA